MPDLLLHVLFESPLVGVVVLSLAAAGSFVGIRGRSVGWLMLPLLLLTLAAGNILLTRLVITDREAAEAAVRALVSAAAPFDPAAFDAALAPGAELRGPDGDLWMQLEQVREQVAEYAGRGRSVEHEIKALKVDPVTRTSDGRASTFALLRVASRGGGDSATGGLPTATAWELDVRQAANGAWQVHSLRWLELNLQRPPDASAWR